MNLVPEEAKKTFPPEFLNRLDETIVFQKLTKAQIQRIARKFTDRLIVRVGERGVKLRVEDSAADILAERGFEPAYGARPLRRAVQAALETLVAEKILEENPAPEDTIIAAGEDGEISLRVESGTLVGA